MGVCVCGGGVHAREEEERGHAAATVGIVGPGKVGRFLAEAFWGTRARGLLELAFVCDPVSPSAVRDAEWLRTRARRTRWAGMQRQPGRPRRGGAPPLSPGTTECAS